MNFIDARQVPRELREVHRHVSWLNDLSVTNPQAFDQEDAPEIVRNLSDRNFALIRMLKDIIPISTLYYTSEDMITLVEHACSSMPRQVLLRTDLPSSDGFMIFGKNIIPGEFVNSAVRTAIHWTSTFAPHQSISKNDAFIFITLFSCVNGSWQISGGMSWELGKSPNNDNYRVIASLILTTWTLMQQKLAAHEIVYPSRPECRRWERMNRPVPQVRVTHLRRTEQIHGHEEEFKKIDWQHRWLVGGHWRNQWLPSLQAHRQQWIAPYVKGPADKPLVIHEKVRAFVK